MPIEYIRRMMLQHMEVGGNPTKITMNRKTYDELKSEAQEIMTVDFDDPAVPITVYGMDIEIRDDIDPGVMFIVS